MPCRYTQNTKPHNKKQMAITITKTVQVNVTLTKEQKADLRKYVVDNSNIGAACAYAKINYRTFIKSLKGEPIQQKQRDKLIAFCEIIKKAA